MATRTISEVMTPNPIALPSDATVTEAARAMRDSDIGPVLVLDGDTVCGIVTDRDIAVKAIAEDRDPHDTKLGEICSEQLVSVTPGDPIDKAVQLMKDNAIRRLPVMENGKPVGIVSLGDLAEERDPQSALGRISQAPPNNP